MPEKTDIEGLKTAVARLKRNISELKCLNLTLTAEKRILDEILESLPGTFFIWDDQPRLIRWNKKHEEITGYSADAYVNMRPTDFFSEKEHRAIEAGLEKVFTDGEATIEATLVTKSGKKIPHVYSAVRMMMGDKPVLMGFGIDISERNKVEQQLRAVLSEMDVLKNQLEADRTYLREEIKLEHNYENIIGNSDLIKYVLFRVEQVAPTDTTVLILGETGTGKELIARAIHNASPRKERPLIKLDCASLPMNLIESELFGHEKGAFTGAVEKRVGRFELAHGATLFLDEIGELPLGLQPKLLRVLQDGEFERLGSSQTIRTDVRVIAATNRNLEEDVRKKKFRMDLWYRLNVFAISIPALRERREDIALLVNYIIKSFERKHGKRITSLPTKVLTKLQNYSWPGNVREMENVLERAIINTQGDTLQLAEALDAYPPAGLDSPDLPIKSLAELEQEHILRVLKNTNYKIHGKNGAADLLDINPSTLRGRMRKHGIQRPPYQA